MIQREGGCVGREAEGRPGCGSRGARAYSRQHASLYMYAILRLLRLQTYLHLVHLQQGGNAHRSTDVPYTTCGHDTLASKQQGCS